MTPVCFYGFFGLSGLIRGPLHQSELNHGVLPVTVGGVPSPGAEPPGSAGCREGRRVGEASRTSRPCTGLRSTYGPLPPGSSVSTSARH